VTGGGKAGACSFDEDPPVLMADGTHKPISEIKVGGEVLAADPETSERTPCKVTALIVHHNRVLAATVHKGIVRPAWRCS
jgi:hypothetical protein